MEFELFIKDNSFLPETVDIKINTTIVFKNTDLVRHTIRCKGNVLFSSISVEPGRAARFTFEKPGRYEITEADIGDMKVSIFHGT
jgi:plastocyanin